MKIGVVFPQTEIGNDPAAIKAYAQTAEALGYTHVLAYDHVLGANRDRPGGFSGPYDHTTAFHEVFVLFSFLAGVTTRLELVTGILILPQRQTALAAKQAASLDLLSGGRLRLGVGLGWNEVEYSALNEDFHNRGKRIEEQVAVMRRLWTEPLVNFSSPWHTIPDAGINPLPVQRPIPVWFGGHVDAAIRRIARIADGWMPGFRTAAEGQTALAALDRYLAQAGRSREGFGLEPRLSLASGDPQQWREIVRDWQAAGATHLSINSMGCGYTHPDQHIQAMQRFKTQVIG